MVPLPEHHESRRALPPVRCLEGLLSEGVRTNHCQARSLGAAQGPERRGRLLGEAERDINAGFMNEHYFDWNSTAPLTDEVWEAMAGARRQLWGNPASVHGAGRRARSEIEATREALATVLGFHPRDVLFTGGGTEANNLALHGAQALVLGKLEHPSVLQVARHLEQLGKPVVWLPTPASGWVSPREVEEGLAQIPEAVRRHSVVTVSAANHETGVLQPVDAIAQVVHGVQARLHVDAVQLFGKAPHGVLDAADSVAVTAHKLGGPKGIGALLYRGVPPRPLLLGGAQERGLRPGTQDAIAAVGFRVAVQRAMARLPARSGLGALRDGLERSLARVAESNVGNVPRLGHVASLSFAGFPGPELAAALDLEGVRVSSGSACSAGTEEPSPVIAAMLGPQRAHSTLRISMGETTTAAAVDSLIATLFRVLGNSSSE